MRGSAPAQPQRKILLIMRSRARIIARRRLLEGLVVAGRSRRHNDAMIPWLRDGMPFPPIGEAMAEPNGLLAASSGLSAERLLDAYSRGIFPWYNDGQPVLWWSPDPRTVLFVDEFRVPRSLRKVVAQQRFDIRVDTAFREVIERCAEPRSHERRTWITPVMIDAYTALHR